MPHNVVEWGESSNPAPSIRRINPWGWVIASAVAGAALGFFTLAMLWRPVLGFEAPVGSLGEHLSYWMRLAVRLAARSAFAEDAGVYSLFWKGLSDAERFAISWRVATALVASGAPSALFAGSFLRPRDALLHLRGSRRFEGREAIAVLNAKLRGAVAERPDHEIAPGVPFPTDMHTRHILLVGGTGSGKSTVMKGLIDQVVGAGEQILLFDPKSEFTTTFGQPEIFAPWDARSLSWDIARDMRNPLDMRRFAAAMIRDSHDPMWSNASRQLLVGVMIHLKATRGDGWGWSELADYLALPQVELLEIMRRHHPEAVRSVEKASVTTAGILINLASFCSPIFDLAKAWEGSPPERRVSFVEWILQGREHRQLILQGHGGYAELTKSYVEGIVGLISAMVSSVEMDDDSSRKISFIADEFAQMGKLPGVRQLFEMGRSRGVRCCVAVQDLGQLEEIYGAQMVKAIVSMCGTMVIGQMMQGETAKQLCEAMGSREVERPNVSVSRNATGFGSSKTFSFSREEVALYKPSELASRLGLTSDGKGVKLILFTGGDAHELVWPHFPHRKERPKHMPALWTASVRQPDEKPAEAPL